jgi:hypothetical protein
MIQYLKYEYYSDMIDKLAGLRKTVTFESAQNFSAPVKGDGSIRILRGGIPLSARD